VTTEGLLMYFMESEAAALCEGIRRLLAAHGGCWLMADPEMIFQNLEIMRAVAGERFREVFESSRRAHERRADVHVDAPVLMVSPQGDVASEAARVRAFLAAHGLVAERMVIARHMPTIETLKALGPEVEDKVRQGMEGCAYWMCTLKGASGQGVAEEGPVPFDVSCETFGDLIEMRVEGRMDTLTSPDVLELFERRAEGGTVRRVRLDCSGMTYISSAGLRVLMIMCKRCDGGVTLTGVAPQVREILAQTGFDDVLTVL
jgi:anti-anti-sigma factor